MHETQAAAEVAKAGAEAAKSNTLGVKETLEAGRIPHAGVIDMTKKEINILTENDGTVSEEEIRMLIKKSQADLNKTASDGIII